MHFYCYLCKCDTAGRAGGDLHSAFSGTQEVKEVTALQGIMVAKLLGKTIEGRCYRHFEEKHSSTGHQGVTRHREGGHQGSESGRV